MQMGLGTLLVGLPVLAVWGLFIYVIILVIRALKKYINGGDSRPETAAVRKSLGEAIKARRTECNMTQEFVAGEQVGERRLRPQHGQPAGPVQAVWGLGGGAAAGGRIKRKICA